MESNLDGWKGNTKPIETLKSVSVLCAHYKSWKWLAIAIHSLKHYGFSGIPFEIVVADNSPGHPSIKAITETSLGEGVKVVQGDVDLPSQGQGNTLAYAASEGSHIFTIETDSMATRHGWFEEFIKASANHDYIGPHMSLAGGIFIHPCGALASREVIEAAKQWQRDHSDWVFVAGAGIKLGLSDKAYHVVCHEHWLLSQTIDRDTQREVDIWKKAGPWQCMISWDDDNWGTYMNRNGIQHLEPRHAQYHLRMGYEPGQWLSAFAQKNFRCFNAPCLIEWIPGWEGRQAAKSTIFGGFTHIWAGTSATVVEGLEDEVKRYKRKQMAKAWLTVPEDIRSKIEKLEAENA